MDIFDLLALLGGLALFLYGMDLMGKALEKKAGGKLKSILANFTSNKFKGFILGFAVTAVIQSSSATTVMVVGFVNSGLMTLGQAVGVIMGANLGTCVTSWILSLTGITGGDIFWLQLLKPESFTPVFAFVAIIMLVAFKNNSKKQDTATIFIGFAILMYGMEFMSSAVSGLKDVPEFTEILLFFSNPILGVLVGIVLTAIIQSSSASVGILQALSITGRVSYATAIPIIMGQHIGTCITALISSFGANKNAKRAAFVHLLFNVIGSVLCIGIYLIVTAVVDLSEFISSPVTPLSVAIIHTSTILLSIIVEFPLSKYLEKLAGLIVRDDKNPKDEVFALLDERLLSTPSIAIERSRIVAVKMARVAAESIKESLENFFNCSDKIAEKIRADEDKVDKYEDNLGTYLVKVSSKSMSEADSHEVSKLLHIIGDFERISDHAVNIIESAEEIKDKGLSFSEDAKAELNVMISAVIETLDLSLAAFENNDLQKAVLVEPIEQVVDSLKMQLKTSHVNRLRKNECTIEMGFVLSDILTNLERVSDHCSNIAICIIEIAHDSFDMHDYVQKLKMEHREQFDNSVEEYRRKYSLKTLKESGQ